MKPSVEIVWRLSDISDHIVSVSLRGKLPDRLYNGLKPSCVNLLGWTSKELADTRVRYWLYTEVYGMLSE